MIVVRDPKLVMTGAAAGASAVFAGKPNSRIARGALNIGHSPPNVIDEATLVDF